MEMNDQLIQAITKAVVEQFQKKNAQPQTTSDAGSSSPAGTSGLAGRTRMRPKRSYAGAAKAAKAAAHLRELPQRHRRDFNDEREKVRRRGGGVHAAGKRRRPVL